MRLSSVVIGAALVALTACGGGPTQPRSVDLSGNWSGTLNGTPLTLTAAQHDTQLLGTGMLGPDEPFTVTGTFIDPQVMLSIDPAPYTGFTLSGQQHGDTTISVVANGYLLNNVPLVLKRQ